MATRLQRLTRELEALESAVAWTRRQRDAELVRIALEQSERAAARAGGVAPSYVHRLVKRHGGRLPGITVLRVPHHGRRARV